MPKYINDLPKYQYDLVKSILLNLGLDETNIEQAMNAKLSDLTETIPCIKTIVSETTCEG